jgi:hypothetical protein
LAATVYESLNPSLQERNQFEVAKSGLFREHGACSPVALLVIQPIARQGDVAI